MPGLCVFYVWLDYWIGTQSDGLGFDVNVCWFGSEIGAQSDGPGCEVIVRWFDSEREALRVWVRFDENVGPESVDGLGFPPARRDWGLRVGKVVPVLAGWIAFWRWRRPQGRDPGSGRISWPSRILRNRSRLFRDL